MRNSLARARERFDDYTVELQRHGLESVEREVRWLNELIETERANRTGRTGPATGGSTTAVPHKTSDGRGQEEGSLDPPGPPYDRPGRSDQER